MRATVTDVAETLVDDDCSNEDIGACMIGIGLAYLHMDGADINSVIEAGLNAIEEARARSTAH